MKKSVAGKTLYKYYKHEVNSFLLHFNKAKINPDEKNIHRLRVTIKKIKAIYRLLEMYFNKRFKARKYYSIFKSVFKNAGEIRKIHIILKHLDKLKLSSPTTTQYRKSLSRKKEKHKRKFKKIADNFDTKLLDKSNSKIHALCNEIANKKLMDKYKLFIQKEALLIEHLLEAGDNPAIIHKIRIHLKSLGAIEELFYKLKSGKKADKLLALTEQTGDMIGLWHDKVMFVNSVERFLTKTEILNRNTIAPLVNVLNKMKTKNQFFYKRMKKAITPILKIITHEPASSGIPHTI